ncbi:MAG: ComEC/Rec2 family competence protein [Flavobacteriales bacterium]|nr:ComEC/Rec2 family competence protein [Flavobacteriales bacterium]
MATPGNLRSISSAVARAPLLRVTLPFTVGAGAAAFFHPPLWLAWIICSVSALAFTLLSAIRTTYPRRWQRGFAFSVLMLAFGLVWLGVRDPRQAPRASALNDPRTDGLFVEVAEVTGHSLRTAKAFAEVEAAVQDSVVVKAAGTIVLTLFDKNNAPLLHNGDRLWIGRGAERSVRVADPGGFDAGAWAASHGAGHEVFAGPGQWRLIGAPSLLDRWTDRMRNATLQWIEASGLDREDRGMVKALLLGIRDELDADQKQAFARSGTIHVLAVSGMHVGLVYAVFMALLGWWGRKKGARLVRGSLVLLFLWGYAGLTGWSPSVMRATIMFTLFTISEMSGRQGEPLNTLFGAAFVLLIWDPLMLFQLSFQLSFLAVLGILLFYKPIMRLWYAPNTVLHYFWSLTAVSLAAQVITTPLSLYMFKAFPVWFLPANLAIVGLVSICVYAGALMVLFHQVPYLGPFIIWCNEQLVQFLGWCSRFFADLPWAYPAVRVDALQMVLLYLLIALVAVWSFWRWRPARFLSVAVVLVLFISWASTANQRNQQRSITVYAERERLSLAMVNGRRMTVVADSVDVYLQRKVELHARSVGAQITASVPVVPELQTLRSQGLPIIALVPPGRMPEPPQPDVALCVLHGNGRFDLDSLLARCPKLQQVVLAPDIPRKRLSYLRQWFVDKAIAVHDVDRDGAFILGP